MDSREDLAKLEEMFDALREEPESGRPAVALRLADGDARLARRAVALVAAHERTQPRPAAQEALRFGPYRVLRVLGSGGMGTVYIGERDDGQFDKKVAIKVMAPHAATDAFRERFLAERRILAGLQHPNITTLLDGGFTPDGAPYLVIEYIDGASIDRHCDDLRLTVAARIRLFLEVCAAVEHAHRNLVIHRDLKPSNVLVDAGGHPKLLDFGTARLLEEDRSEVTVALATPRYASPEQLRGARLNVATDIYSLGVMLCELVTGAWPFGGEPTTQAFERATREVAPAEPRLGVTLKAAEQRSTTVAALRKLLAGDLWTIVGKALEHEPERRYASVHEFAGDLEAYLAGLPVRSRPASATYRVQKFLRRHAVAAIFATLAIAGLLAATTTALLQASKARVEAERARQFAFFTQSLFSGSNPNSSNPLRGRDEGPTAVQVLENAALALDRNPPRDSHVETELRVWLMEAFYTLRGWEQVERQLRLVEATQIRELDIGQQFRYYQTLCAYRCVAQPSEAREPCERAAQLAEARPLKDGMNHMAALELLARYHLAATTDYAAGERLAREAVASALARWGAQAWKYSSSETLLSELLSRQGKLVEATKILDALERAQEMESPPTMNLAATRRLQRYAYRAQGDIEKALAKSRSARAIALARLGLSRVQCGDLNVSYLIDMSDSGHAAEVLPDARAMYRACTAYPLAGTQHTETVFGLILTAAGQAREAEPHLRRGLAESRRLFKPGDRAISWSAAQLARALTAMGQPQEAKALLLESGAVDRVPPSR